MYFRSLQLGSYCHFRVDRACPTCIFYRCMLDMMIQVYSYLPHPISRIQIYESCQIHPIEIRKWIWNLDIIHHGYSNLCCKLIVYLVLHICSFLSSSGTWRPATQPKLRIEATLCFSSFSVFFWCPTMKTLSC